MILQYTDIFNNGKICKIKAEITTDHPVSSYGLPVVVLPDGNALDAQSWILLNYQVISLNQSELPIMQKWITHLYAMMGFADASKAAAELGRKGGSSKSSAKQKSSRENGKLGGRPKKSAT